MPNWRAAPVLARAIAKFDACQAITSITVVIHPDDHELYAASNLGEFKKLTPPVTGGPTRQESVRLGLEALSAGAPDVVLIHDAARPFVTEDIISRVLAALEHHDGALAAVPWPTP